MMKSSWTRLCNRASLGIIWQGLIVSFAIRKELSSGIISVMLLGKAVCVSAGLKVLPWRIINLNGFI